MVTSQPISLDDAAADMVLAADLLDSKGHFLLPGKTVLTATVIASLKRHHVTTVSVLVSDESDSDRSERDAADLSNKIARLDTMFKAHEADPLNQQLKTYPIHFYSDGNHEQN